MLVGTLQKRSQGFTLIEVMVVVAVLGILSIIAVPSFQNMMKSTRVRTAAEAVQNGLQKARAEAISRNKNVKFTLNGDTSWTVGCETTTATCPNPIESRPASDGSKDIIATATPANATVATFNNLGRLTTNLDTTASLSAVNLSIAGVRNLQVTIGAGGQIKMCDPNLAAGSSPRAC